MQILRHAEKIYFHEEEQYINACQGNERWILSVWDRMESC